jgi:UDP-4-amino-4,6-dideoxy-N-acetyl-beta-L-altrosamine transaminase
MTIPYGRQSLDAADIKAVTDVLEGDWLTQGPAVERFEEAVAAACDVPHAVAFSSGTAALHAAAFAAGVGPGDDVLTSAITFAASANCAAYLGARPRFADIDPATLNVSPATVSAGLTPETKVVIPVHFAGLPAPVAEIREAAGDGVTVIEDAAHALGARAGDEPVGSCRNADMAIFSFHPVKTITSGEGGMVTTRDEELRDRMRMFRNHGFALDPASLERVADGPWYREQQELGFNYRLSDIHSALGASQTAKLGEFVDRRNEVAARYREAFAGVDWLELPPEAPDGSLHAYHLFVIRHSGGAEARRSLFDFLQSRDIRVQVHYLPVYRNPWYERTYGYEQGLCPEAETYYESSISLPCFPALTDAEQDEVIAAVREGGEA